METTTTSTEPQWLFASQREAYLEMMQVAAEVIREIVAAGGKPPTFKQFDRDTRELWDVWKCFAPAGDDGRRL